MTRTTKSPQMYYITKETVIEVGLTLEQAKEKVRKSKVNGMLHIKKDHYSIPSGDKGN